MMKNHTSFKIGGPADLFIYINNESSLKIIIKELNSIDIPFFILGNGSNLLVSDDGYRGVVLSLAKSEKNIILKNNDTIICSAGISLARACVFAMKNSLSGLEFAWGIPGTCGGALFMNAGAYGNDISNIIKNSKYIDKNGNEKTLNKNEMKLSYRKSFYSEFNDNCIISLEFKLKPSYLDKIKEKMYENIHKRKSKQPLDYPNAGSIFKRPEGYFAGTLIENAGLKEYSIGGAMVSPKHAGFIINTGDATAEDVKKLIDYIKKTVFEKFGVLLECEIKTLGNINL
ncbi:MAG: UDP-N-acetylmuramate dehydrogenase [Clostridia bacterium]|nr:UDP-N-acetylmuramate dehydrogenase [Clostridia bacterium]